MRQRTIKMAGFTLLPVVLAMNLIAAIAFLLNRDNGMNTDMVVNQMNTDRARYAAEAGLQAANARVQSFSCAGGFPVIGTPITNSNFGGASYSAYATTSSGNTTNLVSTGTYNGTSVKLTRNNIYVYQSTPKTYTLQPNAAAGMDTYIITNSATNNGASGSLNLTATNFPLIKFDLSMFPAGSRPVSSTLSLYANGGFLGYTHLYRMTGNWQEGTGASGSGANWTTSNGTTLWLTAGGDYHPNVMTIVNGSPGNWLDFETTDLTSSWLNGSYPNYGVRFTPSTVFGSLTFTSSDNSDAAHWPKMTFNYMLPCSATGPSDPTGGTVTLSPAADGYDDTIALAANDGAAPTLRLLHSSTREARSLIQFDTSSIPAGSTVQSAKLRMYVNSIASPTTNLKSIWVNALNEPWVEGTGANKVCPSKPTAGSSWNYRTDCTNWSFIHPPNTAQAWTTMAKMPTARTNHMVATVNNKIYTIGGYNPVGGYFNTVEEYDPATNTWTAKAPMLTARSDAAVAVVNGKIYVFGGSTGSASDKTEEYDPATNIWTTKKKMLSKRMYLAAAAVNNKIYVIGGAASTAAVKTNEEYDPATDTWTTKTLMTTARMYLSIQAVNGKIYAIGGWTGAASLTNNEMYDPSANTWTAKAVLSNGTDSMASAVLGNKIYLIGGMRGSSATNAVVMYDTLNNAYTAQLNYPVATDVPAAAAVNGYIYSMGGDDGVSVVYQSHYKFDPGIPTPVATASDESTAATPLAAGFTSGWINFDLKPLVQEWVDGVRPNNGVVIYTEVADQFSINSRENSSKNPQLIVTY
ncbi:MAG: DNRLRE domain-containing protein [Methylotenera sp.]